MDRTNDHDLLITIHTQVNRLITDVGEINNNLSRRVTVVETEKLSKEDFKAVDDDKEKRMRRLERYGSIAVGALWLWEFASKLHS